MKTASPVDAARIELLLSDLRLPEVDSRRRALHAFVDKLLEELREGLCAPVRGVDGSESVNAASAD
jgi:hypothetical protein